MIRRAGFLVGLILVLAPAWADAPGLVSYQGRLVDDVGSPITSATQLRFRLYYGGDDATYPSTGTLAYHELATVTPSADGVFSHLIGSGTAQAGCAEGTCQLVASDFLEGTTPMWIEVLVDPDGTLGNSDDDVLLPRTRFGAVGYAMRADQLDGYDAGWFLDISGAPQTKAGPLTLNSVLTLKNPEGTGLINNLQLDFGNGYGLYSDDDSIWDPANDTRVWLDGPDDGEMVLGPRQGAEYLANLRLRTNELSIETFDGGGSTLRVTGGDIGIKLGSPTRTLHVNGTVKVSGHDELWSGWGKAVELNYGNVIQWLKGPATISRGIGFTSNSKLHFLRSTADDSTGVLTTDMVLTAGGRLGIGITSPTETLTVNGSLSATDLGGVGSSNTLCSAGAGTGRIGQCTSSLRFKDNVRALGVDGMETIAELNPVEFEWKSSGVHDLGFVAEQVAQVAPLLVSHDGATGEPISVRYSQMAALLVKAMQEQQETIEGQERRIDELEQMLRELRAGLNKQSLR